jgi:organic radical activating enzyme
LELCLKNPNLAPFFTYLKYNTGIILNPLVTTPKTDFLSFAKTTYPVMEHFYTIQGEGFWSGTPAYFIRLGGCDVGCVWCDVKESWDAGLHPQALVSDLLGFVQKTPAERLIITGGEPCLYDLTALTNVFREAGYKLHIETSGAYPLTGTWDWVCFSPKKFKPALNEFYAHASELKIIVYNQHDLKWAETHAEKCSSETILFLQPEWSKKESIKWIIEYIKYNPKWRISLQTHKFMNIP